MRMILLLAFAASLSACALPGPRPPTEASIAKAADRTIGIETGYAITTEAATLAAHATDAPMRAKVAAGDRAAFDVLSVGRRTYPLAAPWLPLTGSGWTWPSSGATPPTLPCRPRSDRLADCSDHYQHAMRPGETSGRFSFGATSFS